MPELPDITIYLEALEKRVLSRTLEKVRLANPFVLRTVEPAPRDLEGKRVEALRRIGKRIVFEFENELFLVIHLMIAGRFKWLAKGAKVPGKVGLAAFDFDNGTLVLTEAGSKRRASLHIIKGEDALRALDPGGIDVLGATAQQVREALTRERHTLKRTLTDPHVFSGIGNAYSDEIHHRARLSPFKWTTKLTDEETGRLFEATKSTLNEWISRLQADRRSLPDEGHRLPPRNGRPRPLRPTLSRLRLARPAHRPRRERIQLLRHVPDRRQGPRRPRAVAAVEGRLAPHDRGMGSHQATVNTDPGSFVSPFPHT